MSGTLDWTMRTGTRWKATASVRTGQLVLGVDRPHRRRNETLFRSRLRLSSKTAILGKLRLSSAKYWGRRAPWHRIGRFPGRSRASNALQRAVLKRSTAAYVAAGGDNVGTHNCS